MVEEEGKELKEEERIGNLQVIGSYGFDRVGETSITFQFPHFFSHFFNYNICMGNMYFNYFIFQNFTILLAFSKVAILIFVLKWPLEQKMINHDWNQCHQSLKIILFNHYFRGCPLLSSKTKIINVPIQPVKVF